MWARDWFDHHYSFGDHSKYTARVESGLEIFC